MARNVKISPMLHSIPDSPYRDRLLEVVELQKKLVEALCDLGRNAMVDLAWLQGIWSNLPPGWVARFWTNNSGKRAAWIALIAKAPKRDKDRIRSLLAEQLRFADLYASPPSVRLTTVDWRPKVFEAFNDLLKSFYAPLFYKGEGYPNQDGTSFHKEHFIGMQPKICPYSDDLVQDVKLDHFLPKDKFPMLSLHPGNLIPCGTDSNSGGHKGTTTPLDMDAQDQAASWFHPRLRGAVRDRFEVKFDGTHQDLKACLEATNASDATAVRNMDELFDLGEFWSRHLNSDIQHLAGLISGELRDEGKRATEPKVRTKLERLARQKKRSWGEEAKAIVHSYLYTHILNDPAIFSQIMTTCDRDTADLAP